MNSITLIKKKTLLQLNERPKSQFKTLTLCSRRGWCPRVSVGRPKPVLFCRGCLTVAGKSGTPCTAWTTMLLDHCEMKIYFRNN